MHGRGQGGEVFVLDMGEQLKVIDVARDLIRLSGHAEEEIEKAIVDKNPKVALLHKVGPEGSAKGDAKCWKFIVTAAEGNPLYYDSHKISQNGAGVEIYFVEITADNFRRGGEVILETKLDWRQAQVLAVKLLNFAGLAKEYESEQKKIINERLV